MGSAAIPERLRSLHSTYVGELQELFTSADLPYGSPRDIAAAVQRMRQPGTFADEFRCAVRSIILREGGSISNAQLMEILTLAISGPAAGSVLDREPAAVPASRSSLPPRTAVASFLLRFSPPALPKVLLASVSLVLLAESLFLFLHRDALIPVRLPTPAAEPRPASAAPAAVSAAAEFVQAAARSEPAFPSANPPAKPSAYGEAFAPPQTPPTHRPRASARDSDYVAPPRVLQAYTNPSATPASSAVARPVNPPDTAALSTTLAAPVVRQPASAFAGESHSDPDDFIAGDPRPVRPEAAANAPRFDISSGQMSTNLVFAPRPEYPALARLAHIQGNVVLKADIAADGRVSATHILSGHRLLRGAAAAAVRRWRYRPYIADGRPVDITTIVTVGFHANR